MKKLLGMSFLFLIISVILTGCGKDGKQENLKAKYNIYYLDTKSSGIVSESYEPAGTKKEELVEEFLRALKTEPKNMVYKRALPDSISIKEFSFSEDKSLIINFEANYSELKGLPEVLCRATIVKTLSQIPGVDYIIFNVNSQPLIDSNGIKIGLMRDEDFMEAIGAETNYKVTLYYAAPGGETLVATNTVIDYTGSGSIEEIVINQLINGPIALGMYKTMPEGTTLLNVNSREGVCYVDFNEKFLDPLPGISEEATIYSIVNSLAELSDISKVQFQINGKLVEKYRDFSPFSGFFERNLDIVEAGSK